MKVVHVVPGSGGTFYCQNCLRDGALVQALRRAGEDVVMVPMYLPMFTNGDTAQEAAPVFFGGINVWLQQQIPLFRKTPRWLDRLFDSGWMLKRAARMEGTTSASELGAMTLSMLEGIHGNQKKELERLLQWLEDHERPDVVHLSNALLIGLADPIKARLGVPVVCTLQDEDWWLDELRPPYDQYCWEQISVRTGEVDRFVAVSNWYADKMSRRLLVPREQIDVVHVGIDLAGYEQAPLNFDPPVLGFLSRMNEALGLERLVDAFIELKKIQGPENLKLKATGGAVGADLKCIEAQKGKLSAAGVADDAEFIADFSRAKRQAFLKSIDILCVPVEQGEAFGSYIIEAMAAGVPVVQPKAGAFPELIEATGGGIIYENPVDDLKAMLLDPERVRELGAQGRKSVHESFSIESMAQNMVSIYRELIAK